MKKIMLRELVGKDSYILREPSYEELKIAYYEKAKELPTPISISSSADVSGLLAGKMGNLSTEQVYLILVDNANKPLWQGVLSAGTEDQSPIYPKDIARKALLAYATGVLIAHNHPTGNLKPSPADLEITRQITNALKPLDIRFLDHVIIGKDTPGYFSFREQGLLP